jgi:nucleoside-diphosphate-sugar epimerase
VRILVTGNMGYIGPVISRELRRYIRGAVLIGYDTGFFAHCLTNAAALPETRFDIQHFGDIRSLEPEILGGVDAIVHLAAISNDPMGNRYEEVTREINEEASIRLARLASAAGVKSFVFASSCSIYGFAEGGPRKEEDELNPLTAYARSKIGTERGLAGIDLGGMTTTCLRFATACGMSDRLRLDLVLNDFVACALSAGEITVLSDGTPWRPMIDVEDMGRAIAWALQRPAAHGGQLLAINAGSDAWNYQVRDLADAVASAVPGTRVSVNLAAPPDKRSYRVDFGRFAELAPDFVPRVTLHQSIQRLKAGLQGMGFADRDFRNSSLMRLKTLERHIAAGRLDARLRWTGAGTKDSAP